MSVKSVTNNLTLLLALLGCVVAIVLTYEEFHPTADIGCSRFGGNCLRTVQSSYGKVGPIPTSVIGLGMYLTIAGLCLARGKELRARRRAEASCAQAYSGALDADDTAARHEPAESPAPPPGSSVRRIDALLWGISIAAIGVSWWLQYVALFTELCSFCPWCFASAIIVTLIFGLTSYDFLIEGRTLDGEQKLLAAITAFIIVCFGFVFTPVLMGRIRVCGPNTHSIAPEVIKRRDVILVDYLKFRGDPKARYVLVEFADYQCPHCKKAAPKVEKLLQSPPNGPVRFAFRNFPLETHNWARAAAAAAEAAGEQGKFWEMHDLIFAHQEEMSKPGFDRERFDKWADELGLDVKRFNQDSDSRKITDRIVNDRVAGGLTGLTQTPTFYLVTPTQATRFTGEDEVEKVWRAPKSAYWK